MQITRSKVDKRLKMGTEFTVSESSLDFSLLFDAPSFSALLPSFYFLCVCDC